MNEFANYFQTICTPNLSDKPLVLTADLSGSLANSGNNIMPDKYQISIEAIEKIIMESKPGKAAGLDGLMVEHLSFAHPIVMLMLKKLFNVMLEMGYVPTAFGEGLIIPIPKLSNTSSYARIEDFRGITISPVISKVFEHCVLQLFQYYLESDPHQFGFKKGKGCRDAVYVVNEIVDYFVTNQSTVNICTVDLSKAFDKLNHNVLFKKLIERKTPPCLIRILIDWYGKCSCIVKYQDCLSRMFLMKQGIRQGGVLSPVLFALYVDDVLKRLNSSSFGCNLFGLDLSALMYADDIILLTTSVEHLQKLLDLCNHEFGDVGLKINVSKCAAIRNGPRFKLPCADLFIGKEVVPWVYEIKYLGVTFTQGSFLKVSLHANKVKFFSAFNSIYARLGSSASCETLIQLMKSNCLSALLYNLESVTLSKSNLNDLSFPLNRAFVKIFHVNDTSSISWCQFYMCQLPIEFLLDYRKFKFYKKLKSTDCPILEHVFHTLSVETLNNLCLKYALNIWEKDNVSLFLKTLWGQFHEKLLSIVK